MSDKPEQPVPTEINLHSKSRMLSIAFSDGARFELPCEYLRVFSHAAEVLTADKPISGKEQVNIDRIEPQGSYAVRLVFDDGHDTGIYSWQTLYDLGLNQEKHWADYLQRLEAAGIARGDERPGGAPGDKRRIRVLYFAYLANKLRKESEEVTPPDSVVDIEGLLKWLGRQKRENGYLLAPETLRFTVNKQFAEPFTRLENGDELALVPNAPTPPSPPGK